MDLTFKINQEYDVELLLEFLPEYSPEEMVDLLGINQEELATIERASGKKQIKTAVERVAEEKYERIVPFMSNSASLYQDSWDKIIKEFSSLVEKKTGVSWRHKEYHCVVSAFHWGISSWGGDTIVRKWSIHPDVQRPVTAHELVLSHFWTILEEHPQAKQWEDEDKWKYCEILSWCLLGLEDDFHKFWPWLLEKDRWPLDHEYPEIVPLQEKIGAMRKDHKNFKEFLKEAIKVKNPK